MPYIEEEEFVNLCKEIDTLKAKEENLRKGYIDLKLQNNKMLSLKKSRIVAIAVLFLLAASLSYFVISERSKVKNIRAEKQKAIQLLDSITLAKNTEQKAIVIDKSKDALVFSVQIGVFKNVDFNHSIKNMKGVREVKNEQGLNTYVLGEFPSYDEANIFKYEVKKIGIKDAFIVAYQNNKRINIKKALKLAEK